MSGADAQEAGEDLTLEGILREAGLDPAEVFHQPRPQTLHDRMVQVLRPHAQPTGRAVVEFEDKPEQVGAWVNALVGRPIGFEPTWIRIIRPDLSRGALFIVHSPHPDNEAELVVIAEKGVLTRPLIVDVCRWAFFGLGLGRVVVRIPADRPDLADLARRAGFQFEGIARRFYRGTLNAQIWAMTGAECRWLAPRSSTAPVSNAPPPSSLKVH
ncbi:hypothetical protein [Methylobacterium sp. E-046]|uniref:hypothetical protein n=1 Tax=Methylobacterium sp. E-046 TaxID=2836576 RepID=UPI001FB9ACED|nr:hypothetical protein [Methylobacterium sp. E-046]MCJ2101985.1 hypothetical protein [Methylobacterium sp. E-046]